MTMQELSAYAIWAKRQTTKGAVLTLDGAAASRRFRQIAGDLNLARDDGTQAVGDLTKYGTQTDWVNSLTGNFAPESEATVDELAWAFWIFTGGEAVLAAVSEVQTITVTGGPTGGTWTPVYKGKPGTPVAYNATAAAVQTSLESIAALGPGQVTVTGAGPYVVTFAGTQAGRPQADGAGAPAITVVSALTGGTTPAVTVTRTTQGAKARHRFVSLPGPGFWASFFRRVGLSHIERHSYGDCRIGQIVIAASQAQKNMRYTLSGASLDPHKPAAADPTGPALPVDPLFFTDAEGAINVDGTIVRGATESTLTFNEDLQMVYGDSAKVYDVFPGNPAVSVASSLYGDDEGFARWNDLVYGTPTPAAGQAPLATATRVGSWSQSNKQRDGAGYQTGNRMDATIPGVKWAVPDAPGPNPEGGTPSLALGGSMRPVAGQEPWTIDVYCDSPAFAS